MRVLISGTSKGIGRAIALMFLKHNHEVIGLDILNTTIDDPNYTHYPCDVRNIGMLPEVKDVEILINNAGVQTNSIDDINTNLVGLINTTNKYAFQKKIKAVINIASASASTGSEFPYYAASKGGVLSFTKNTALALAKYGATCNSISPGGVIGDANKHILDNKELYDKVLNESLLNKWAKEEEIAQFAYFLAIYNKSMTGEDLLIDNGEKLKANFIW
ncbi:MAG: SDR family oxidoreductase [Acholeplasmatales bacterium]|nr:SDR family oxidoreductase [Acholeplasmatales bacterium]